MPNVILRSFIPAFICFLLAVGVRAQQPYVQKPKPGICYDAKNELLRGPVQTVVVENESPAGAKRKKDSISYYDKTGLLQQVIRTTRSTPVVEFFDHYEGERVSWREALKPENRSGNTGPAIPERKDPAKFDRKISCIYDNSGRLIDKTARFSNGNIFLQQLMTYKDGKIITLDYIFKELLGVKIVESVDGDGNVLQREYFDISQNIIQLEPEGYYTYEEFDSKGNWTKRSLRKSSKPSEKPQRIETRAIVYYP